MRNIYQVRITLNDPLTHVNNLFLSGDLDLFDYLSKNNIVNIIKNKNVNIKII